MNGEPAISFDQVSKTYSVGDATSYGSLRDDIASVFRRNRRETREIQALQDVSFSICSGEAVALVGRNGAGKSTTLKLIGGITKPTQGRVAVNGRIAPLMELGAGFHHELTGRENIAFFAAILGMSREELLEFAPRIIEFSELGDFIDVPVKKYSNGMLLRLGFATAIHSPCDILMIDEVLAVGDMAFVNKCHRKVREMQERGCTLFFVSHDANSVARFTDRSLLFEQGKLIADGRTGEILEQYGKTTT